MHMFLVIWQDDELNLWADEVAATSATAARRHAAAEHPDGAVFAVIAAPMSALEYLAH